MSVERYMVDDAGTLIDKVTRDNYDTVEEVVSILNHYASTLEKFVDENEQLRQLNIPMDQIKETVKDCKGRIIGIYYND